MGSGVVASVSAGSGSDFFEVSVWGCEPAALEPVDAPWCPPGPAPAALVRHKGALQKEHLHEHVVADRAGQLTRSNRHKASCP